MCLCNLGFPYYKLITIYARNVDTEAATRSNAMRPMSDNGNYWFYELVGLDTTAEEDVLG